MKERFFPALQEQALRVERKKIQKHKAAEELGERLIPQVLASRERTELFFAGIQELESKEEEVLRKMCRSQVVGRNLKQPPQPEVLMFLSEQLTEASFLKREVAANLLEGIFLYPTRLYKKDKKRHDQAIKAATETLSNFAWAMVFSNHPPVQEKAVSLFHKIAFASQGKTFFDLAGRPHLLSSQDWEESFSQSTAAVLFLDLLFIKLLGNERYEKSFDGLFKYDQAMEKWLAPYQSLGLGRKERIREMVLEIEEKIERLDSNIETALSQGAGSLRICPFSDKEPLMNEVGRLQMEVRAETLLREKGMEFVIVDFPGGGKVLIFSDPFSLDKEREKEIIGGGILTLLSRPPHYREKLGVKALEAIIDFLGPNYSAEVLASSFPRLYEKVQTGILALPGAGQRVRLRLAEEEFLRQMGLTSLFFKPSSEGGILVRLEFGQHHYSFTLDRNFKPKERKKAAFWEKFTLLGEEKKLFLLNLAYSYLDSLLHPQEKGEEILGIRKRRKGESELMTPGETKEYLSRTFLRVLPLGHRSHKIGDDETEERIEQRFGYPLERISQTLLAAEEDLKILDRLKEREPRLWGITQGLIERIKSKGEEAKWVAVDNQLKMKLKIGQKGEEDFFSLKRRICYEVTAVLGQESRYPKEVVCPKAATRIISGT